MGGHGHVARGRPVPVLGCRLVVRQRAGHARDRRVARVPRALVRSRVRVHVPRYAEAVVGGRGRGVAEGRRRNGEGWWC